MKTEQENNHIKDFFFLYSMHFAILSNAIEMTVETQMHFLWDILIRYNSLFSLKILQFCNPIMFYDLANGYLRNDFFFAHKVCEEETKPLRKLTGTKCNLIQFLNI
jgi:hypothetical protein